MFPRRSVAYYSEVLEYSVSYMYMGVFMICQDIMKKIIKKKKFHRWKKFLQYFMQYLLRNNKKTFLRLKLSKKRSENFSCVTFQKIINKKKKFHRWKKFIQYFMQYLLRNKKKPFWDLNFLKRDLKTFHVWLSSINVPVWLGAHGTVFQKLLLFHVLSMKNNTGCSVQKREPISAQQGGAGRTLYSTSNSAQYKLLFQRRETRAAHLKPFKEVAIWLASD